MRIPHELDGSSPRHSLPFAVDLCQPGVPADAVRHPVAQRRGLLHTHSNAERSAVLQRVLGASSHFRAVGSASIAFEGRVADGRSLRADGRELRVRVVRWRRSGRGVPLCVHVLDLGRVVPSV